MTLLEVQRMTIELLKQASGNECSGVFTLSNQTSTILGGGYALEISAASSGAIVQYLPSGDAILIPGFDIEVETTPDNINQAANIFLQGEVTQKSILFVDLPLFALRTILDVVSIFPGMLW